MPTFDVPANPLKPVRVKNLNKLNLTAKELVEQYGRSYSYWQGLLNGSRPFAEKTARSIEDDIGLGRNWLDQADSSVAQAASVFRDLSPEESGLITIFRQLGAIGGREEQDAAAYEMNKRLSRANAASAKPTASHADPFPGVKRARTSRPDPAKQLETRAKAKPLADSKKAR